MEIRKLTKHEINNALPLVWRVFNEYEAVNYPPDGAQAFWNAIHDEVFCRSSPPMVRLTVTI